MAEMPEISFVDQPPADTAVLVVLTDDGLRFGRTATRAIAPVRDLVDRASKVDRFKGKKSKALELIGPAGLKADRLIVMGTGKPKELKAADWPKLGGAVMAKIPPAAKSVAVILGSRRWQSRTGQRR